MAPKKWRGQEAVLSLSGGNLPTDAVGVLQNVTVTPDRSAEELRGAGTTKFVDVMETARHFDVSAEVLSWDPETWDRSVEWDDAAGESDGSADVERFDATVELNASDGSTKVIGFIDGYFNPPPEISGDRESWQGLSIELRFPDVDSISNTDAST